jgi:hypothetical protein
MSMKKLYRNNSVACFLSVVLAIVILFGCSEKGVNENSAPSITLSMKITEPALMEMVSQFRLTVTGPDMRRIDTRLALEGCYVVGEVRVPAGRERKFDVRALDETDRPIYQGDTTLDIEVGTEIVLNLSLYPQVPLVKLSPRFLQVPSDTTFALDVKVFNIDSLYGISFRIYFGSYLVRPDSAIAGPNLDPRLIYLNQLDYDAAFYAFAISQVDEISPIVDGEGNAALARVFFSSFHPEMDTERAELTIEVMELTRIVNSTPVDVPVGDVLADRGVIEVRTTTEADSIVSFRDPRLEDVIRQMIEKPSGRIFQSDVDAIGFLAADGLGISDLSGLANLTNLHYLNLEFNQVSNISELSSLTKLGQLFLGGNKVIRDISPLAGHPQLFEVGLEDNQIRDLAPLDAFDPNNTLGLPAGLIDKVWLSDNPQIDTTQVDTLCGLSVWVDLDGSGLNWCSGL